MRNILKFRWLLLGIWIIGTVIFALNQPDLNKILNKKGEVNISRSEPSQIAAKMLDEMGTSKGEALLLVFSEKDKISDSQMQEIQEGIKKLNDKEKELGITSILDPFNTPEAKDQLVSKDKTTVIIPVTYEQGTRDNKSMVELFYTTLEGVKVTHYVTGTAAINSDYLGNVAEGVDKSGIITVIFILLVLIILFRSIVTPFVSLLAVGISYICSMGIIGILVNKFDFPVTSLTQMFVILVLFGIGTDYHILLFNRFKEELSKGDSVEKAIITTYKTAGKTVIYSGLTVFMAFASLSFVKFSVYRSANAVAIGIVVLLLEILVLTPVILRILGKKMFWPSKKAAGHKESHLWEKATGFSYKHSFQVIAMVAILVVPIILMNSTKLSFNMIKDLSDENRSVKGFNIVTDKFGAGQVMQTTIVIKNKESMDDNESLAILDEITEKLKKTSGVAQVYGPTQPKGEMITDLYTNNQTETVAGGLTDANDGLNKVQDGLSTISQSLKTPDYSEAGQLIEGTDKLQNGIESVGTGLEKIQTGIDKGAGGADELAAGIDKLKDGVEELHLGISTISTKLGEIQSGYEQLGAGYEQIPGSIEQLQQVIYMMQASINALSAKYPEDTDVITLQALVTSLNDGMTALKSGMETANGNYAILTDGLSQLKDGLTKIEENTNNDSTLVKGIEELSDGASSLADGLRKGSAGQTQVIDSLELIDSGAEKIKNGQTELVDGLSKAGSGISQLKNGIDKSNDGLGKISDGIGKSTNFLDQLTSTKSFYIPDEAKDSDDLNQMFDMYMSEDRKIAKLVVTLEKEPYDQKSIEMIDQLNNDVKVMLKGTKLENGKIGIAGATSNTNDLKKIATHDILFTQIIVLAAIFVLLVIVIRSFFIPLYIVISLIITYYTSISLTSMLATQLFESGKLGLSWNVPFFAFVTMTALGVDYSIFLMERFREHREYSQKDAIIFAAKNVGGVVMSAAVILAGTFATMYPSNIIVLMELAICIVIGLFLLSFIFLPLAIPAMMALSELFSKKKEEI